MPKGVDGAEITRIADGVFLARDLINTPPNDMGPGELAAAARKLAKHHKAHFSEIVGEALLKKNYPLIHAVGMGSVRPPCLIDLNWGRPSAPKVTLVGKGVVFDTGGYDLKTTAGMATMKKDMGGAAVVLAVAHMVMDAKLDIRLRVLDSGGGEFGLRRRLSAQRRIHEPQGPDGGDIPVYKQSPRAAACMALIPCPI